MHSFQKERLTALLQKLSPDERRKVTQKATRLRKLAEKQKRPEKHGRSRQVWDEDEVGGVVALRGKKQEPLEKWILKVLEERERSEPADLADPGEVPASLPGEATARGVVTNIGPACCHVLTEGKSRLCLLKPEQIQTQKNALAVGDEVTIRVLDEERGLVLQVQPRENGISRPDPHCPEIGRILAANLEIAVLVSSLRDPDFRPGLIDRMLVAVFAGGMQPFLVLNKIDLIPEGERARLLAATAAYRPIGVRVFPLSAHTGEGVDAVRQALMGHRSAFIGHSGVGKSSLLNRLFPDLHIRTNAVRESDGKGRHTTTAAVLHDLGNDTRITDCPGIREFSVGHFNQKQIRQGFPEFAPWAGGCRFADCSHTLEPECQVRAAAVDGRIAGERYRSYRKLVGGQAAEPEQGTVDFICGKCGFRVSDQSLGTRQRNHCPRCLWSRHLDHRPGDRLAGCDGLMEPVTVWVRKKGEWAIIHRCQECGVLRSNRIAGDDNEVKLLSLAMKPLAEPPFSLDGLEASTFTGTAGEGG